MNPPDTPMQQRERVGTLTVRRMYHKPAREFCQKLAVTIRDRAPLFLAKTAEGYMQKSTQEIIIANLPQLVADGDGLFDFLVAHSTDDAAAVEKLDLASWLEVAAAALRLNCGDDLKKSSASVAEAFVAMLADYRKQPSAGPAPTSSSSKTDSTQPT